MRILSALAVLWTAIVLSLQSDDAVYRMVEYYIPNWMLAAIILRITAALLFALALLVATNRINISSKFLSAILLFPIADSSLFFFGKKSLQPLFLITGTMGESIIISLLLIFSMGFILKMKVATQTKKWIMPALLMTGIALSFIKPVYIDDWRSPNTDSELKKPVLFEFLVNVEVDFQEDEPILIAFFTTNCDYCAFAAQKMGISERNDKLPQTLVVFPGTKEDAMNFMADNKLENVQFVLVDHDTFFKYAGHTFPSLYFVTEKTIHHYTGANFGFRTLEYIACS